MKMDAYSTHQALLVAALTRTDGDIVEMGGGWYSTPLVSSFANNAGRLAWTIETNAWVFNLLSRFQSDHHAFEMIEGFPFDAVGKNGIKPEEDLNPYIALQTTFLADFWAGYIEARRWRRQGAPRLSVAFIDQAPGFLRVPAIQFFASKADFIITHDTEHVEHYGFEPTLSSFKSRWDFSIHKPNSVILSNFRDCSVFSYLAGK